MKTILLFVTLLFAVFYASASAPATEATVYDVGYAISVPDATAPCFETCDNVGELPDSIPIVEVSEELLNLLDPVIISLQRRAPDNVYVPPAYHISYAGLFSKKSEAETGPIVQGFDWTSIINIVLLLFSVLAGGLLTLAKKKGGALAKALTTILDAVDDNKITPEEEKKISAAIRAIFEKEIKG
jgi:hypothetical protein